MKRIFIMDGNGIQEYVPASLQSKVQIDATNSVNEDKNKEDQLLTISDLVKKFQVTRPTIYAWMEKGLLRKISLGGRVLFHPNDINKLIDQLRDISSQNV